MLEKLTTFTPPVRIVKDLAEIHPWNIAPLPPLRPSHFSQCIFHSPQPSPPQARLKLNKLLSIRPLCPNSFFFFLIPSVHIASKRFVTCLKVWFIIFCHHFILCSQTDLCMIPSPSVYMASSSPQSFFFFPIFVCQMRRIENELLLWYFVKIKTIFYRSIFFFSELKNVLLLLLGWVVDFSFLTRLPEGIFWS